MWKHTVKPEVTDINIIWRMRIACWITKATNTQSRYVILIAFPLQQWLHERPLNVTLYLHRLPCLSLVGDTCSTGKLHLMAQESVTYYPCGKCMCNGNHTGNFFRHRSYVFRFSRGKHISPIASHRLLIEI